MRRRPLPHRPLASWLLVLALALLPLAAQAGGRSQPLSPRRAPGAGMALERRPSGLLLPSRRIEVVQQQRRLIHPEQFRRQAIMSAQWNGARREALQFLRREGTRLSPRPYQRVLSRLMRSAEETLRPQGASAAHFKPMVIEGPPGSTADGINAGAWTGGIFTMNRGTIDFAYRIADAYVASTSEVQLHTNLADVATWQRRGGEPPQFKVHDPKLRDRVAEGILGFVVNHEIGHALLNHVGVSDPGQLWTPPRGLATPPFNEGSRAAEADADAFSFKLGMLGAIDYKAAMPLLPLYWHIQRPDFDPNAGLRKGRQDATHPAHADRFNFTRDALQMFAARGVPIEGIGRLPPRLEPGKLWVPTSARRERTIVLPPGVKLPGAANDNGRARAPQQRPAPMRDELAARRGGGKALPEPRGGDRATEIANGFLR